MVTASKAVVPTAKLYSAVLVVLAGSFPIYIELSSIIPSDNELILELADAHDIVPEPLVLKNCPLDPSAAGNTQILSALNAGASKPT